MLLTRSDPLNVVVNSGRGEGLVACGRLLQRYDNVAATSLSGLLLGLMSWSFGGDMQARIELFERELARYEKRASEIICLNQRMGWVLVR